METRSIQVVSCPLTSEWGQCPTSFKYASSNDARAGSESDVESSSTGVRQASPELASRLICDWTTVAAAARALPSISVTSLTKLGLGLVSAGQALTC